jgi:hypothetical protein
VNKTDLGDDSAGRVKREPQVRQRHSRLETAAQGLLFVILVGLFMTLVFGL